MWARAASSTGALRSARDGSANTRVLKVCERQLTSRISWTSQAVSNISSLSWAVPSTLSVLNSPLCGGRWEG